MENIFAIKGAIVYSKENGEMIALENGYLVCRDGLCDGVYEQLPKQYQSIHCRDFGERLIIPGFVDLHMHAPQYAFRGLGMDLELLDWLNAHTFKEETKYADLSYAQKAYDILAKDIKKSATTRICMFATMHKEATLLLMQKMEETGIKAYVGKVNMDRNVPEDICEKSAKEGAADTEDWILQSRHFGNVKPILTPRFTPACTQELLEELGKLQVKYHLPLQSHLSENVQEVEWVKELCPGTTFYAQSYDRAGVFGNNGPTVMAHCIYSGEEEMTLLKERNVFVAHCPESNANLASGIAPIRRYLKKGIKVGLGSDVAAGSALSMFRAMAMAVRYSKLRWRMTEQKEELPLTFEEAFFMATVGGGEFFGKVGSFEKGYEFDAVVLDDSRFGHPQSLTAKQRLERLLYLDGEECVATKFVAGQNIYEA